MSDQDRDPRASRAGHPGEGHPDQALCVPGWDDGSLTDEELAEGLRSIADVLEGLHLIGPGSVSEEDVELLREGARRIEELTAEDGQEEAKEGPVFRLRSVYLPYLGLLFMPLPRGTEIGTEVDGKDEGPLEVRPV